MMITLHYSVFELIVSIVAVFVLVYLGEKMAANMRKELDAKNELIVQLLEERARDLNLENKTK